MAEPIRFDPEKHTEIIGKWCDGWKIGRYPDGWLPTVGFIVPDVAYASLYISDSSVAWIENVISNPEASDEDRDKAIFDINDKIEETAIECGAKWLRGSSLRKGILERAEKRGYWIDERPSHQIVKLLKAKE